MPNTRPATKGALAMLEAALERIQALGDPARAVTPAARQQAASAVEAGAHPLYAAAEATGLDMSPAARMQRALDQGYSSTDYKRITVGDEELVPVVEDRTSSEIPVYYVERGKEGNFDYVAQDEEGSYLSGARNMPLRLRDRFQIDYEDDPDQWLSKIAEKADSAKLSHPHIPYSRLLEHYSSPHYSIDMGPEGIYVLGNDNIRSTHAAFDPANRGTGYLMGSKPLATSAAGGLTLYQMYKDKQRGK